MSVKPVDSTNFYAKSKVNFSSEPQKSQTPAQSAPKPVNTQPKWPYYAGAAVLAALGITYAIRAGRKPKTKVFEPIVNDIKEAAAAKAETPNVKNTVSEIPVDNKERNELLSNLVDSLKVNAQKKREAFDKKYQAIAEFNKKYYEDALRIVSANNWGGYIDIPKIEKAAMDYAADVNRPDNLKQAANLLEVAYNCAYYRTTRDMTSSGLENLLNRITNESTVLFDIYEKMPYQEAVDRITYWAKKSLNDEEYKSITMHHTEFLEKTLEALNKRVKTA